MAEVFTRAARKRLLSALWINPDPLPWAAVFPAPFPRLRRAQGEERSQAVCVLTPPRSSNQFSVVIENDDVDFLHALMVVIKFDDQLTMKMMCNTLRAQQKKYCVNPKTAAPPASA